MVRSTCAQGSTLAPLAPNTTESLPGRIPNFISSAPPQYMYCNTHHNNRNPDPQSPTRWNENCAKKKNDESEHDMGCLWHLCVDFKSVICTPQFSPGLGSTFTISSVHVHSPEGNRTKHVLVAVNVFGPNSERNPPRSSILPVTLRQMMQEPSPLLAASSHMGPASIVSTIVGTVSTGIHVLSKGPQGNRVFCKQRGFSCRWRRIGWGEE